MYKLEILERLNNSYTKMTVALHVTIKKNIQHQPKTHEHEIGVLCSTNWARQSFYSKHPS